MHEDDEKAPSSKSHISRSFYMEAAAARSAKSSHHRVSIIGSAQESLVYNIYVHIYILYIIYYIYYIYMYIYIYI